jgi:hypothetical protein
MMSNEELLHPAARSTPENTLEIDGARNQRTPPRAQAAVDQMRPCRGPALIAATLALDASAASAV